MFFKILKLCVLLTFMICVLEVDNIPIGTNDERKISIEYPCKSNTEIVSIFNKGVRKGYVIAIMKELDSMTEIRVKLDSSATINFGKDFDKSSDDALLTKKDRINNDYVFVLRKSVKHFAFIVKGRHAPEHPPYIISLKINDEENCIDPDRTYFGRHPTGIKEFWPAAPNKFCGRRRVSNDYTELIVSGTKSKLGDWPWHIALYKNDGNSFQYICGGTLISKLTVLTAAHCVTMNKVPVNPEKLKVLLGRSSFFNNEVTGQDRTVYQITVHEDFENISVDNDIALLKLGTEVTFNNYIQPACLWLDDVYDQVGSFELMGTVVGWGIDKSDTLSKELQESTIPMATKTLCMQYNPNFYHVMLWNGRKFCAGFNNGTAPCNGDSGGGFMVFVPDTRDPEYMVEHRTGAWYVRGIVSTTKARQDSSLCDPNAYTVFTDVATYRDWILLHMK